MTNPLFHELAALYTEMEKAYATCADAAGLSCQGCTTNCCTSYFQHHTYIEWAYLWQGLFALPVQTRQQCMEDARAYIRNANQSLASGMLPDAMCPLNKDGLCSLYSHRLMICRLHGTRNSFTLPSGEQRFFPGCNVFASLYPSSAAGTPSIPTLDRTPFYRELARLEMELLRKSKKRPPKVNMSIAEMIAAGSPKL